MKKVLMVALALGLAAVWTTGPAIAADESTKDKLKNTGENTKDKLQDTGEKTKDKLQTTGEKAKDKLQDVGEKTKDKLQNAGEKTKEKLSETKEKVTGKAKGEHAGNADVRAAQQALKDKGHDPGPIDGKMGPRTSAALKDYQKAEGMKVTGRLDTETSAKLGVSGKTSATETTPSASPAAPDTAKGSQR